MRISDWSSDVCSSDLLARVDHVVLSGKSEFVRSPGQNIFVVQGKLEDPAHIRAHMDTELAARTPVPESCLRSEEHTSVLQSLMRISYAVFCLKKKKPRSHSTLQ